VVDSMVVNLMTVLFHLIKYACNFPTHKDFDLVVY
jgi:hypothetical protein